jgi:hypothetical protein
VSEGGLILTSLLLQAADENDEGKRHIKDIKTVGVQQEYRVLPVK